MKIIIFSHIAKKKELYTILEMSITLFCEKIGDIQDCHYEPVVKHFVNRDTLIMVLISSHDARDVNKNAFLK